MSTAGRHRHTRPCRDAGQSMVEYLVVVAALVAALFVIDFDGRTGAQHLADLVRLFYRNLSYFLSLP